MNEKMGRIHSYQSLGTVDGPGVRFVVFLQGCALRCIYCHNPDTWSFSGGKEISAKEVFQRVLRYRSYFFPDGGITVSGGEALLQPVFVRELFVLCQEAGIHTALDTSGCCLNKDVLSLLNATDLCLLDLKMTTAEAYRHYVGCELSQVLAFLQVLEEKQISTWIRHVVVPGLTDTKENLLRLRCLTKPFSCIKKIELLPFRKLCLEKYAQLGLPFLLADTPEAQPKDLVRMQNYEIEE